MTKKVRLDILVPLIVALLFAGLNFVKLYETADSRVYDILLRMGPGIEENDGILLLDVDDLAIEKVGMWPWSRHIMADGLITMREFGARYAVFDIEYTENSPLGVNSEILSNDLPDRLDGEFGQINQYTQELFAALKAGQIDIDDIDDYVADLTDLSVYSRDSVLSLVENVSRNNDDLMGQSARFFADAFYTVTTYPDEQEDIDQEYEGWILNTLSLTNVDELDEHPDDTKSIRPTIQPILESAGGIGSPTVIIDEDGVRRRIDLIHEYKDFFIPQLAFSALLDWFENPQVLLSDGSIVLAEANVPGRGTIDVEIPLAEDGNMLINWPKATFEESFTHLSYYYLVLHDLQEDDLIRNLRVMFDAGYMEYLEGGGDFFQGYDYAEQVKNDIMLGYGGDADEYAQAREYFFDLTKNYLFGPIEGVITDQIAAILTEESLTDEERDAYRAIGADVVAFFDGSRTIFENFEITRSKLAQHLKGAYCIIGWTGTSTTDRGVNPFDKDYVNVGTHAAVINTIIQTDFIDNVPWWYAVLGSLALVLIYYFVVRNLEAVATTLIGLGFLVLVMAGGFVTFYFFGLYLNLLTPFLTVLVTFIIMTIVKFILTAQEKSFIRDAFGHYLSNDVINQLLVDPDRLDLGGELKYMTAIFTDVKGFSSISEKLDPTELVNLLNIYLTGMSDTILDLHGTIDKYEGDAIISFFGAPVELDDHATRACQAALHMAQVERNLNRRFMDESLSPVPLQTRIGINTGEMVVGNMGTQKKMDYTIMGNAVNLAARLEGVNKLYGTWILISEETFESGGKNFVTRKMDRVRVVNIDTPVRLYELVAERDKLESRTKEVLDAFHDALDLFEVKDWSKAETGFSKVLEINPDDGPSSEFLRRAKQFQRKAPPANWDGVFKLAEK